MIHRPSVLRRGAWLAPVLALLPACSAVSSIFPSSSDHEASFVKVDDLLGRVERVHVDCELAGQTVREAIESLMVLVGPEFRGDAALAYEDFALAIEIAEEQAKALRESFDPMDRAAEGVFERWEADLEAFSSDAMRQHSEERMTASRTRYEAVSKAVDPAILAFEDFNRALKDQALYLGNDFSADSISVIEKELRDVSQRATSLSRNFERATRACQEFVRKGALRGQVAPAARKDV